MPPETVISTTGRIHRDFSHAVAELVVAARELQDLTDEGYNPTIDEILAPEFYTLDTDEDEICDESIRSYLRAAAM